MILDATGRLANARHLPMQAVHIRAMCDGDFFLEHYGTLQAIDVEPYCRHCAAAGLDGALRTVAREGSLDFRCAHTGGWATLGRGTDFTQLLDALGWGLRCTACREPVAAANSKTDTTFRVTCLCTTRTMANPVAPVTPTVAPQARC